MPNKACPTRRGSMKATVKRLLMRRKVANLRKLLGIVVTAVQAGRSVYHTIMLGQAVRRVKHKVCQLG